MALNISKKTLYWTIASVVVAVVGILLATFLPGSAGPTNSQNQSGSENQQAQNGGMNAGRDINIRSDEFQQEAAGLSREQAEKEAEKYRTVAPPTGVPAPFLVLAPRHLWVRSSAEMNGQHIGAAYDHAIVWVDCSLRSAFDPDTSDKVGAEWLKVRWPTDKPGDVLLASQPSDKFAGWVYAGLTLPSGHNGQVPACAGT